MTVSDSRDMPSPVRTGLPLRAFAANLRGHAGSGCPGVLPGCCFIATLDDATAGLTSPSHTDRSRCRICTRRGEGRGADECRAGQPLTAAFFTSSPAAAMWVVVENNVVADAARRHQGDDELRYLRDHHLRWAWVDTHSYEIRQRSWQSVGYRAPGK